MIDLMDLLADADIRDQGHRQLPAQMLTKLLQSPEKCRPIAVSPRPHGRMPKAEPEFLQEFDTVVLSSQAPAPKPDPAIYTFAHGQLPTAVPITETAFVGETLAEIADDEQSPTSGARAVGMIGIHLSDAPPSPLADFTVPTDDLPAIAELVAALFTDGFESGDTTAWSSTSP